MIHKSNISKYGARKITNSSGTYDSKLEYYRFLFLQQLVAEKKITRLRRQVPYELIPKQFKEVVVQLKTKQKKKQIVAESACYYLADFVYCTKDTDGEWKEVVEDTKGVRTRDYIIKRKLMLYRYGIAIKEVSRASEEI